ncbi:MAG: DNA repair protein RadC [Acholeplasmataceae bacterium]|jgi:DNA repair protein RadC|nr:DNA repair protein RadC [Acholeplasmataceae bacterium]
MKELPIDDRPREKLINNGAAALTDSELLAILIGSGTQEKSALDIARDLTADYGILKNIAKVHDVKELAKTKGLGHAKAAIIIAALELGRRIAGAEPLARDSITSPEDGVALLMPRLRYESKEHFVVVLLNSKNKVLEIKQISEGSLNSSVVHPREVFAPAVLHHAAAILTAHNHPSGDPTPSKEDKDLTNTLVQAGKYMGIPVLDHIIIGDAKYFSFKEHSYL